MTKQTFLDTLRVSLSGAISATAVEENVRYYEEYINSQIRMGKSEEQVLAELGNPRLIARSIIDAGHSATETGGDAKSSYGGNTGEYYTGGYQNSGQGETTRNKTQKRRWPIWAILIFLLILIVVFVVLRVLVMFVWWLAPVIVIVWLVTFAIKLLRRK